VRRKSIADKAAPTNGSHGNSRSSLRNPEVFTSACYSLTMRALSTHAEDKSMKHKKHSAKALVFDPLFRTRQEKSKKGKGSYARRPRNQSTDSGPFSFYAVSSPARAENTPRPVHARAALPFMTVLAPYAPKTRYVWYTPGLRCPS
jgi:stalled ribosome alternative rescue factor ArfA